MREIKFRGKRLDNGKWAIGDLRHHDDGSVTIITNGEEFKVALDTVGQYTGLKDKNGKEIYEADVMKITQVCPKSKPPCGRGTAVVVFDIWNGWSIGSRVDRYARGIEIVEVIGNIYDNPELLKGCEQ